MSTQTMTVLITFMDPLNGWRLEMGWTVDSKLQANDMLKTLYYQKMATSVFEDVIILVAWVSLPVTSDRAEKFHSGSHISRLASEFSVQLKSTRESPEFPDEAISGHILGYLEGLGVGITSL